jgi:hypothetical protein
MPDFSQNFNRYSYCLNNPLKYTDPTGEYFGLDDLIAAAIGGVVNLTVNIIQGNIKGDIWTCIGKGAAAFGAGAAAGWGALYPEFGGWVWGGATVGATNAWLSGAKGWDIAIGAGVGAVSGVAGGAAGQFGGKYLGGIIINGTNVTSPVLQGAITGTIGGATGGYVGGFTAGYIMTGDLGKANEAGLNGAALGAPIGGISGSVSAYRYARDNGLSPWTGEKLNNSDNRINNYTYDERVRMRALDDPTSHNFPYSYDESILSTTPIVKPDGYMVYRLDGTMNGMKGYYEIGITKSGVINHRFFRPSK